jgi:hypothetical protein
MHKNLLYLTVILFIPFIVFSQKIDHLVSYRDIDATEYFRFNYDNDYFAATDENYTQGYNFELVSSNFEKNPINALFFKCDTVNTKVKYGLAIEHIGFTPNNYASPNIQLLDRPFAAAIYLKSFYIATNTTSKIRVTSSLNIGLIGPGAFGEEMQVGIHEATGNKIPRGWKNQIKNDLVLNYDLGIEKQLFEYNRLFSIQANGNLKLGTLFTSASIGASTQIGIINSVYQSQKSNKAFRLYFYSEIKGAFVGYDASLQGGLFNRNSPYTIASKDLRRFTAQLNYGIVLKTRTMYFEYTRTSITREISSVSAASWGGIKVGFTL